jgi:signal transduction histidine kinase
LDSYSEKVKTRFPLWERYLWLAAILWTLIVAVSALGNVMQVESRTLEIARIQAQVAFDKDVLYRRWNAGHGGVYVPVTEETQPNPYLDDVDERDITTPSGTLLTLMNPAFMTRQVHELAAQDQGVFGHITSLNPIRPGNAADAWETVALQAFERGETMISSVEEIRGEDYMRLMRPLITEAGCLQCHETQGYQEGDIRGGISVSIPMEPLTAVSRKQARELEIGHALLWLFGMGGIVITRRQLKQNDQERTRTENALYQGERKYSSIFENSPISLWEEDYSAVKIYLDDLRASGVSDIGAYFDEHPEAIAHCASIVKIIDVNQTTIDLFQAKNREEFFGSLDRFLVDDSFISFQKELIALSDDGHYEGENVGKSLTGTIMNSIVNVSVAPGYEETWSKVFVYVVDITERIQTEQQHLELSLKRERIQILSKFIAQASHEFRTPLSIINTSTYLLKKTDDPLLQQQHSATIEGQVDSITTLVDELTAMARLDGIQELTTEKVDLCQMLVAVDMGRQDDLQENKISIVLDLKTRPLFVQADINHLQQAVDAIVDNAILFTPQDGTITIHANIKDGQALIEISDTGVGISDDDLPYIFERFSRADKSGTTRGFGLGLPIAKSIIELHQGSIEAQSVLGQGSTFRILLPMA